MQSIRCSRPYLRKKIDSLRHRIFPCDMKYNRHENYIRLLNSCNRYTKKEQFIVKVFKNLDKCRSENNFDYQKIIQKIET